MTTRSTIPVLDTALSQAIERRSGLRLGGSRLPASEAAIRRAMAAEDARHPDEYRLLLERDRAAFETLVGSLTVGETFFFRERAQLELLRAVILPDVVSRRGGAHRVQMWSAGCATGEEAYSLAMVLARSGLDGGVLGTDVSRARLAHAEKGVYGAWSLRGVAPDELGDFLEPAGKGHRVRAAVRRRVVFAPANLIDGPPGRSRFDVVFCRNVLIYLTPEAIRRAVDTLIQSLAIGGWLVLASSDPHLPESDDLERVTTSHGIAYRRRSPGARRREDLSGRARSTRTPVSSGPRPSVPPVIQPDDEPVLAPTAQTSSTEIPPVEAWEECADQIRELADRGRSADALEHSHAAVRAHPTVAELHYLQALLHVAAGRLDDALAATNAALYLRADLVVAHVLRAHVTRRLGDIPACERSLRNARRLLAALPPEASVPIGDGERVGSLLAVIDDELGVREPRP